MKLLQALLALLLVTPSAMAQTTIEGPICKDCPGGQLDGGKPLAAQGKKAPKVSLATIKGELQVVVDGPDTGLANGSDAVFEVTEKGFQYFSKDLYIWLPSSQEKECEWIVSGTAGLEIQDYGKGLVIDLPSSGLVIDVSAAGLVIDLPSSGLVIDVSAAGFQVYGVSPKGAVTGDHVTFTPGFSNLSLTVTDVSNQPQAVGSEIAKKTGISYPTLQATGNGSPVSEKTSISMPTLQRFTVLGPRKGVVLYATEVINAIFDASPGEGIFDANPGQGIFDTNPGKGIQSVAVLACMITVFEVYEDEDEAASYFMTLEDTTVKSFLNLGTIIKFKFFNTDIGEFENKGTINGVHWEDLGEPKK